jgi:hypothetical protein
LPGQGPAAALVMLICAGALHRRVRQLPTRGTSPGSAANEA